HARPHHVGMGQRGPEARHRGGRRRVHRLERESDAPGRPRHRDQCRSGRGSPEADRGIMRIGEKAQLDALDFAKGGGLVPVVTQHARTGEVLMQAWANREALERTLETGEVWYWSRSRGRLWRKGETSGNVQRLVSLHADCDADAILVRVLPAGPACHTGAWS